MSVSVPELGDTAPADALAALTANDRRLLVGVRHHSPAIAAAMPDLLDDFDPDRVLIELPAEFQPWLRWLGHPELETPVALAGVSDDGSDLSFYPFADFSPELAAIRWAAANGVAVEAIDLPIAAKRTARAATKPKPDASTVELTRRLMHRLGAKDSESLWDQLVEARTTGTDVMAVRRAGLLYGWAVRLDAVMSDGVDRRDLVREAYMRQRIADAGEDRLAIVVGGFHTPALVDSPLLFAGADVPDNDTSASVVTSLIAYSHDLLDSRSGYPAGIRDPLWQQRVWQTLRAGGDVGDTVARFVVETCSEIRKRGHVAGVPDSREATRMAHDLARLRGLPAPGRRELLESIEVCLGRGELLGRGRVLARSLQRVLVGNRRGRLAPGTPRSGLLPHMLELFKSLRLPGPDDAKTEATVLRLDPTRSWLDRRRQVAFERLAACGVPYATVQEGQAAGGIETLTQVWTARWRPATEAMIELAGTRGVTLRQAATGTLLAERHRLEANDKLTASVRLALAEAAAACGIPSLVDRAVRELAGEFVDEASLVELLRALALMDRIRAGHVPGLPVAETKQEPGELEVFRWPDDVDTAAVLAAAVRAVEGISGSDKVADAVALLELVHVLQRSQRTQDSARLRWLIDQIARDGSPLMQGAAGAVRATLDTSTSSEFGQLVGSWIDRASSTSSARELSARLRGALAVAAPLFEADPGFTRGLTERVDALDHSAFVRRLPALRDGFEVLSPAARQRLLESLSERFDLGDRELELDADPRTLARHARADEYARGRLADLLGEP